MCIINGRARLVRRLDHPGHGTRREYGSISVGELAGSVGALTLFGTPASLGTSQPLWFDPTQALNRDRFVDPLSPPTVRYAFSATSSVARPPLLHSRR